MEKVEDLVSRAREAQAQIADYTQEQVDDLITAMVWAVCEEDTAKMIAQHTVDETRLGNYDGKFLKIHRKTRAALQDIIDDVSVGVIEEDAKRAIVKIAKPVGVIGALSPSTNPEATPVIKAINAVKGRNAIVVAPHPRAAKTNSLIIGLMREACVRMGAPADLVIAIEQPSVGKTKELMQRCDRVLATGGAPMVRLSPSPFTLHPSPFTLHPSPQFRRCDCHRHPYGLVLSPPYPQLHPRHRCRPHPGDGRVLVGHTGTRCGCGQLCDDGRRERKPQRGR